jgi:hypothetical protein
MHTTTTIRPMPTRFIGMEFDEHEASALLQRLTAVCGQAGNCQPVQELRPFLEELKQALVDTPTSAPSKPARKERPATEPGAHHCTVAGCEYTCASAHALSVHVGRIHRTEKPADREPPKSDPEPLEVVAAPAHTIVNARLVNPDPIPPVLVDFPTSRPVPIASRIVCFTCDKVFDNEADRRAHDCQRETLERDLNRAPSDGVARKRIAVGV